MRGLIEFTLSWMVILLLAVIPARNTTVLVSALIVALPVFARSTTYVVLYPTFEMIASGVLVLRHIFAKGRTSYRGEYADIMNPTGPRNETNRSWSLDWLLAGIFWVAAIVSSLLSSDPKSGLLVLLSGGTIPLVVYFLIMDSFKTPKDWLVFRHGMCVLGFIVSAVVIAGYWYRLRLGILSSFDSAGLTSLYMGSNPAVLFEVPSVDGAIIVMSLPFLFYASIWQSGPLRWFARMGLILVLTAALFTLKRGVWLAAGIEIILLSIFLIRHMMKHRKVVRLLGIMLLLLMVIPFINPAISMCIDSRQAGDEYFRDSEVRTKNYHLALECGTRKVFSGFGLTRYPDAYTLLPSHPATYEEHLWFAHNLFLTLIPEIGLFGALAFTLLAIKPLVRSVVLAPGIMQCSERWVCVVAMIGALVNALITGTYLVNTYADPEVATLGCAATIILFALAGVLMRMGSRNWIAST